MSSVFTKCVDCIYLHKKTREEVIENGLSCEAYPEKIPWNAFSANEKEPCANGYSWKSIDDGKKVER